MKYTKVDFTVIGKNIDNGHVIPNKLITDLIDRIDVLERNIAQLNTTTRKLKISKVDSIYFINTDDILYLKAERNYTDIFLRNGKKILVSKTLKYIEKELNSSLFFRVHYSYLVNRKFLFKYNKSLNTIILDNDKELPVSRNNKRKLEKWI